MSLSFIDLKSRNDFLCISEEKCIGMKRKADYKCRFYAWNKAKALSIGKNRGTARYVCPKALLTVEAAVVLPFFVCFLVFVLYFFRVLQVQAGVEQALQYAGRRTAAEYSMQAAMHTKKDEFVKETEEKSDESGFGLLKAKLFFTAQLKKQNCPTQYISHGIAGISLLQSDFSGNYVELKAIYRMKLSIALLGEIQYRIVQESKCRKWTGYQPGQDMQEEDAWLYYTEYGTVYHTSRSCTHLDLSIRGVPYTQAASSRNKSGGKYHKCEKCGSGVSGNATVYITDYGDRYHSSLTCSGLKRKIYMVRRTEATEKRMCKKCGK